MPYSQASIDVRNDRSGGKFALDEDGSTAELIYHLEGDRLILGHTAVPDALGRRGIGGRLILAAIERADDDRLTLVPWCPFARRWLRDHPDAADGVAIDWTTMPPGGDSHRG